MKERAAVVTAMVEAVGVGVAGEVNTGKEGFERRIAVDEGSEEMRAIFDERTEGEEEEREEEECKEVAGERGGGLSE